MYVCMYGMCVSIFYLFFEVDCLFWGVSGSLLLFVDVDVAAAAS